MDSIGDRNLNTNNSKIDDKFDRCTDDKICIYETKISGALIKQEPCDMKDERQSIHNYVGIKNEIIEDPTVVVQETGLTTNIKRKYLTLPYCEGCGEEYDLYCLKCPMLIRIFDSNNPKDIRVRQTFPKGFIDICESRHGVGIVALKAIPKGVVFGPFEGLNSTKDNGVLKWKLKNKELAYTKDPKRLNWMQYVRRTDQSTLRNLTPFQYQDALYFRSDCHISMGDELLVCWDSSNEESGIQDIEDGYWKPQVCERLDDTYACTLCCVGYKSICHLAAHNSRCIEKRKQEDFCKEIIQCAFCKIYLDKKEYSDYHIGQCCERNTKECVEGLCSPEDTDKLKLKDKYVCSLCEYSTSRRQRLKQHQQSHINYKPQKHVHTHTKCNPKRFRCHQCGERFSRFEYFAVHLKKEHSLTVYKCDKCIFETTMAAVFKRHLATHEDVKPYGCNTCDKQFRFKQALVNHVRKLHNEKKKKYKCLKCDFVSIYRRSIKEHFFTIHSNIKRFKCPRCAFKTSYKVTLKLHLRYHEDAKPIKCESCDTEFWSEQSLDRHKKEVHAITDKTYSCCKCDYRTSCKTYFNKHLYVHDSLKSFACALCPYKTNTKQCLKRHITVTHNDDRPFKCDMCPKMFKEKSTLKGHVQRIHSEIGKRETVKKEYKCYKCKYRAQRKSDFSQHIASMHDGLKPFACTLCPYKAMTSFKLKQHIATHNNDKSFKCDMCPKIFTQEASLRKHAQNIHSDTEKIEYKCPECPFGTKYKTAFKNHVNAHNKSELFNCSKCDFNTYHRKTFNKHRIRHKQTRKHVCYVCLFRANDECELDEHLRMHKQSINMGDVNEIHAKNKTLNGQEGPKCFDCPTCGMTFNSKGSFTIHIKRLHASLLKEKKSLIESDD